MDIENLLSQLALLQPEIDSALNQVRSLGFDAKPPYVTYFKRLGFAKKWDPSETEQSKTTAYAVWFGFSHLQLQQIQEFLEKTGIIAWCGPHSWSLLLTLCWI